MMKPIVELFIEELVLHGVSVHNRYEVAEAVQKELTRLFTEQGVPSSFNQHADISSMRVGSFHHQHDSVDGSLGKNIATTVYNGFSNGK